MTDPLIVLIIAILGLLVGALTAHLYHRATMNDVTDALAEAERLIAGQARDKELLQREFAYINSTRDKQLLGLAEQIDLLEAEVEKLRAGVRGRDAGVSPEFTEWPACPRLFTGVEAIEENEAQ